MNYSNDIEFALTMDSQDELARFRNEFCFPKINNVQVLYFCGNSLGLQPKNARLFMDREMNNWAEHAVEGHFKIDDPWFSYHERLKEASAKIVGALPSEVVIMNSLTVNLHLLMVSFYRPTQKRYKIICELGAFPSDQYAFESQVRFHGFDPKDAIVELSPREGEYSLRTEDIEEAIHLHKDELALVMMGGINYYTGQLYNMEAITKAGHEAGAVVGFDLAHAAGNVKLEMHEWGVDFAVWCTYKYLNSGPGGVAGAFVHERHARNVELPRFAGWWGNEPGTRFQMKSGFMPAYGADGWQLSNSPILLMASLRASLNLFMEAGLDKLFKKRAELTNYLEYIVGDIDRIFSGNKRFQIITPASSAWRGSQLSILALSDGKKLFNALMEKGVIVDWREPNVIRVAPVPIYNSFEDIYKFGQALKACLETL